MLLHHPEQHGHVIGWEVDLVHHWHRPQRVRRGCRGRRSASGRGLHDMQCSNRRTSIVRSLRRQGHTVSTDLTVSHILPAALFRTTQIGSGLLRYRHRRVSYSGQVFVGLETAHIVPHWLQW
jgi:hypothetical protein